MKKIILNLILLQITLILIGQKSYYSTPTSIFIGAQVIDGGDLNNAKYCYVRNAEKVIRFTPYEVKEYGFKDGRVYISKEIQLEDSVQKVFLERVLKGKTSLYYYIGEKTEVFFLENDSTEFIEIPKNDKLKNETMFNEQLQKTTADCPNVKDAAKLVKYQKKSFKKFISRYNQCLLKPFPYFKYGLILGYSSSKLIYNNDLSNEYLEQIDYETDGDFTIGLFIDKPISVSDFSFHLELYYTKHGYSFNKHTEKIDIDFIANTTSLNLPILLRYTIPFNKIRPFFDLGFNITHNIRNEYKLYQAFIRQPDITIEDVSKNSYIAKNQIGLSLGIGMDFELSYKNSLFVELRYNRLKGLSKNETFNNSEILLNTGINF